MIKSTEISAAYALADTTTYQAGVLQSAAHRRLTQQVSKFLKPYGITMMEWFAIGHIHDLGKPGMRLTDLANLLQTTMPYTTTLTNHLQAKSWLERTEDSNDSRVRLVRLTDLAEDSCAKIEKHLREDMRKHLYSRISREELQIYIHVLNQLSKA